jgi:hypothetical protein
MFSNLMTKKNIDFHLQNKVRRYISAIYDQNYMNSLEEKNLIEKLPTSLKNEFIFKAYHHIIYENPFFKNNFSEETLKKLVLALKLKSYLTGEIICDVNKFFCIKN